MAHLLIQNGTPAPQKFELNGDTVTIGRAPDNTIVLDDPSVSSHHADIVSPQEGWVLRDLGSSNGTKRNGHRWKDGPLKDGDAVQFAQVTCRFHDDRQVGASSARKAVGVSIILIGVLGLTIWLFSARHRQQSEVGVTVVASVKNTPSASKAASDHSSTPVRTHEAAPVDPRAEPTGTIIFDAFRRSLFHRGPEKTKFAMDLSSGKCQMDFWPPGIAASRRTVYFSAGDLDPSQTKIETDQSPGLRLTRLTLYMRQGLPLARVLRVAQGEDEKFKVVDEMVNEVELYFDQRQPAQEVATAFATLQQVFAPPKR